MTASPVAGIGVSVGGNFATLDARLDRLATAGGSHAELSATALHITIAGRDNAPRVEAIARICAGYRLSFSVHAPIAINLMDETHLDLHEAVLASSLRFAARIGARLRQGSEKGELRNGIGETEAWAIMGMNVFLGLRYGVMDDAADLELVASAANALLCRGLAR